MQSSEKYSHLTNTYNVHLQIGRQPTVHNALPNAFLNVLLSISKRRITLSKINRMEDLKI